MLNQNDILDFLQDHLKELKTKYNISRIGLFGSFARNEQNENSDIDIMMEFEPGTENIFNKKIEIKDYLNSHLNRNVDLCREKYVKPFIKEHLQKEVIYVRER